MVNLLEGQLWNDVVSRVEQSRFSYNSQTEEFRSLNTNFQTYLTDIRQIDDENNHLQYTIEQIRTDYIQTLENHLKNLPENFRKESYILTEAHLERYKSKSRAKRFINEREEFKKRIHFVANNDKEQFKRLNYLQRQDRMIKNQLKSINEQLQSAYNHVEREKEIQQQAMNKIDQLHIQLEQVCIERSKTEFEVQNLREEVKLMQNAKDFLDDEYETILAAQTDANEYFLSCLNESILRIHDDFDQLNKRQMEQVEIEYKQMIKHLEENSLANTKDNEIETNRQHTSQMEFGIVQEEYQSMTEELTKLNGHNQVLSERILAMEADLYAIRNTHLRESINKDNELQQSKMELESLNQQLNHLTEYDRNLKFELTLYRGVLESEYRRKQQQQQLVNNQQPVRPTVLRTTITRNNKTYPILTNLDENELTEEQDNTLAIDSTPLTNHTEDNRVKSTENLSQEWKKSFNGTQQNETPEIPQQYPSNMQAAVSNDIELADTSNSNNDGRSLFETMTYLTSTLSKNEQELDNVDQLPETSTGDDQFVTKSPTNEESSQLEQPTLTSTDDKLLSVSPEIEESSFASDSPEEQQESNEVLQSSIPSQDEPISPVNQQIDDEQIVSESSLQEQTKSSEIDQPSDVGSAINGEKPPTPPTDLSPINQPEENSDLTEVTKSSPTSPTNEQSSTEQEEFRTSSIDSVPRVDLSSSLQADEQKYSSDTQQPPTTSLSNKPILTQIQEQSDISSPESPSLPLTVQRKSPTASNELSPSLSECQQFPSTDDTLPDQAPRTSTDEQRISNSAEDINDENQITESSDGYDNDFESEETNNIEQNNLQPSINPIEEQETSQSDNEELSISETPQEHMESSLNSKQILLDEDPMIREEQISSSDYNHNEEDSGIGFISSSGYYGTLNDRIRLLNQEIKRSESSQASLTDVGDDNTDSIGEVDQSTFPKFEDKESNDANESNLAVVMEDLRYVYRGLVNEDDLVEINDDFPDHLNDRLEFGDHVIRTLFDNFLTKYLVQPATSGARSKTLDWIEFRDILFPIVTGRYMERHIRKLFDLFDTSKDGYLSFEEIIDLFELLQVNNATELANYMMNEFDKNKDDKLSVDEFVTIVKKTEDMNNNILPEKLEDKEWFIQHPLNEENSTTQSISLEVPVINFPSQTNINSAEMINNQITLLARIFKRVGADVENKQLDSRNATLAMKLTNEFINNNIHISNEDLYLFIDLYLNKKQNSDCFIKWEEFRDIFLPIVNDGIVTKEDISRWFDILDINQCGKIDKEQILHLLRLLQFSNPENVLNKMIELSEIYTNHDDSCTLEKLLFAFDNTDETTTRLCLINEQIKSYDRQWLTKNIF